MQEQAVGNGCLSAASEKNAFRHKQATNCYWSCNHDI